MVSPQGWDPDVRFSGVPVPSSRTAMHSPPGPFWATSDSIWGHPELALVLPPLQGHVLSRALTLGREEG